MSYKTNYSSYEEPQTGKEVHQKLNIDYLVNKQIDRINTAAVEGDLQKYSNAVEALLSNLPRENRKRLESDKYKEMYTVKIEDYEYKFSCGHKMGSPENPIFRNLSTDWNYKGGPKELVSPIPVEREEIDYVKLFKLIMSELEDLGITWKKESKGNVEKRIDAKPTPVFSKPQTEPYLELVEEEEFEDGEDGEKTEN